MVVSTKKSFFKMETSLNDKIISILPHYTHIIRPSLKHIYLSLDEEGELVIKSPKVSQRSIEQLLLKKASWIRKSQEKWRTRKGKPLNLKRENKIYFLGENYPLILQEHSKKRTILTFDKKAFYIHYHSLDTDILQKSIDRFYKKEALRYIPKIVEVWANKMHLEYNAIQFRKTKRQWGSCSANNHLSFNIMVMKLPIDVIQYIVIHELAHIKHKHHQKPFWECVGRYAPDYQMHIEELKNYTT